MSRHKKLLVLCAALIILLAASYIVTKIEYHSEQIKNGGGTILDIVAADATCISWSTSTDQLSFYKDGDWIYEYDKEFPVDNDKIDALIDCFSDYEAAFTIESPEDISQYGLDNPECIIDISTDEKDYTIELGSYSSIDQQRYVSIGDGKVYLAAYDPYDDFNISINDLLAEDEIPYSFDEILKVQYSGSESYSFEYMDENNYTGCSDDVYFTSTKHYALDTAKVESYLSDISYIGLGSWLTYKATEKELNTYGLDDPEVSVSIDYTDSNGDNQTFGFSAARKRKDRDIDIEDTDDYTAYFKVEGSSIIYEISGYDFQIIASGSYSDLRHDELFTSDEGDIYKISIILEGEEYEFISKGTGEDKKWYFNEGEIDVEEVVSSLKTITLDENTAEEPSGKEEITITVYMKNDNVPEMNFSFYQLDSESCIAKLNGAVRYSVARSDVVDLKEAVNKLLLG